MRKTKNHVHPADLLNKFARQIDRADWSKPRNYRFPKDRHANARLAWEALRRNLRFCELCLEPFHDWDHPLKPGDWGLLRPTHPSVDFDNAEKGPKWLQTQPIKIEEMIRPRGIYPRPHTKIVRPTTLTSSVTIQYGQVAIVFDLEHTKGFKSLLDRQIAEASTKLKELLQFIRDDTGVKGHVPAPDPAFVIPSLRIADAELSARPPSRIALALKLFPRKFRELKENERQVTLKREKPDPELRRQASKFMAERVKAAHELIYLYGYIALLAKDGTRKTSRKSPKRRKTKGSKIKSQNF